MCEIPHVGGVCLTRKSQEWCLLSVRQKDNGTLKAHSLDRLKFFYSVASRAASDHLLYSRDLVTLLALSREIRDHELTLDVGRFLKCCMIESFMFSTFS